MYIVTAHPPPATGVETSSASVQVPDPNINFSTPTCSSKLPIESQTVYRDSSTTSPLDLSAGSSAGRRKKKSRQEGRRRGRKNV